MNRIKLVIIIICLPLVIKAQTFVKAENDTTVMAEYNDGRLWAYRQLGNFLVGMTNYKEEDKYGFYYQIVIFIKNLGETSVTFEPELITSNLYNKNNDTIPLIVYSYDEYMKKVKNAQNLSMTLFGISAGLNSSRAGYQTTYTTTFGANNMPYTQVHTTYNHAAASAANIAATTQMMTLGKLMADERNTKAQGYLKITTIHPNEGIIGYMNIKRKKGQSMTVNIPIDGQIYSFDWDLTKKNEKK